MKPQITLIAAMDRQRVIGYQQRLPWHLPADLRFFKHTTMHKPLLMGRRTWESIGRPLPGRRMVVLSAQSSYTAPGCEVVHSLPQALALLEDAPQVLVIGGALLYAQTLPLAQRLYLTMVEAQVIGDAYFPAWDATQWALRWEEAHAADAQHAWAYRFQCWEKLRPPAP